MRSLITVSNTTSKMPAAFSTWPYSKLNCMKQVGRWLSKTWLKKRSLVMKTSEKIQSKKTAISQKTMTDRMRLFTLRTDSSSERKVSTLSSRLLITFLLLSMRLSWIKLQLMTRKHLHLDFIQTFYKRWACRMTASKATFYSLRSKAVTFKGVHYRSKVGTIQSRRLLLT